ncbi:MAG: ornithine carbamoyltransferase, partial [Verrucomicrobiota bacterium]
AQRGTAERDLLAGQSWAMIFHKPSTRTRVSFEVGLGEMGARGLYLDASGSQMGRGETVADTARVLSRYVHGIVIRTFAHSVVEELVEYGTVPVVNGLTDFLHPCQIYADGFTLAERWAATGGDLLASLKGKRLAFFGDCASNMAHSWILGGAHFGMEIVLCGPASFAPESAKIDPLLEAAGLPKTYRFTSDPQAAAEGADALYTDVWVSMGDEFEREERIRTMSPFRVTKELLDRAGPEAFFMHCLPAHVGEEVSLDVLEDPRSVIFDEAENRLHVQKAIVAQLVAGA